MTTETHVQARNRIVPDYVVTTSANPRVGHLTKSFFRDEALEDWKRLLVAFPDAVCWERQPDDTMTPIAGV